MLEDAEIVITVGQVTALLLLRRDTKSKRVSPKPNRLRQITSTNANVNKDRRHLLVSVIVVIAAVAR